MGSSGSRYRIVGSSVAGPPPRAGSKDFSMSKGSALFSLLATGVMEYTLASCEYGVAVDDILP